MVVARQVAYVQLAQVALLRRLPAFAVDEEKFECGVCLKPCSLTHHACVALAVLELDTAVELEEATSELLELD